MTVGIACGSRPSRPRASSGGTRHVRPRAAPDRGIEARVDEDRLASSSEHPEVVGHLELRVRLAVARVAVVEIASVRVELRVADGVHLVRGAHCSPPPSSTPCPLLEEPDDLGVVGVCVRLRGGLRPELLDERSDLHRELSRASLVEAELEILRHQLESEARGEPPGQHLVGNFVDVAVFRPVPALKTSRSTAGSSPAATPNVTASEVIASAVAESRLLSSLAI